MINKIQALIIFVTFNAVAATYPSVIVGGVVYTRYPDVNTAMLAILMSYPVWLFICIGGCVTLGRVVIDVFSEKGEWITTQSTSPTAPKRRVKVYNMGERDHETERRINGE